MHTFSGTVEHALAHIEEAAVHNLPEEQQRWYAIKIFERDEKVLSRLNLPKDVLGHIETDIQAAEKEYDDDAESIITNERYVYIASLLTACYKKKSRGALTTRNMMTAKMGRPSQRLVTTLSILSEVVRAPRLFFL